jgi:hypothetical protein
LTNIEDSHTNRQCFYLRLSTLVASDGIWAESKRADVESLIRVLTKTRETTHLYG